MSNQYEQRMHKLRESMESFLKEKAEARQAILGDSELAKDSAALLQALRDVESSFAIKYVKPHDSHMSVGQFYADRRTGHGLVGLFVLKCTSVT